MTSAAKLVRLAIALKARLWVDEDQLVLDAPAEFPLGLVQLLRDHKAEVLEYLSHHPECDLRKYCLKYHWSSQADDQDLAEILQTVRRQGLVLIWSTTLIDLLAFCGNGLDLHRIPPGIVPYGTREITLLFSEDADLSSESLRLIHEVKNRDVRIINSQAGYLQ